MPRRGEYSARPMELRSGLEHPSRVEEGGPLRVALADPRPLVRRLLRFLLEDAGAEVVGETDTALGSVGLVADRYPDVLLVNESVPFEAAGSALSAIRTCSPSTKVVVLSVPPTGGVEGGPWTGADAFVREDVPFRELLALATRLSRASPADVADISRRRRDAGRGRGTRPVARPIGPTSREARARAGAHRRGVLGLVAASLVILALVIGGGWLSTAQPGSVGGPAATSELHVAFAALHHLVDAIHDGSPSALADAQQLAGSWARAAEAGADVSRLLDQIRARIPQALRAAASNAADHRPAGAGMHGEYGRSGGKRPGAGRGRGARHRGNAHGRSGTHEPNGHGPTTATDHGASKPDHGASSRGNGRDAARHASRASAEHARSFAVAR